MSANKNRFTKGMRLEAFKFVFYIFIPVGASVFYANPRFMDWLINKCKWVEYPGDQAKMGRSNDKR